MHPPAEHEALVGEADVGCSDAGDGGTIIEGWTIFASAQMSAPIDREGEGRKMRLFIICSTGG